MDAISALNKEESIQFTSAKVNIDKQTEREIHVHM